MNDWHGQDLKVFSSQEVFEHFVSEDEKSIIEYLKVGWLESALTQMVRARIDLGISQKTLAENIGKTQPAIARLEKGTDVKLSVLWDYYAGLGLTPGLHVPLESLDEVKKQVRESGTRNRKSIKTNRQMREASYLFGDKSSTPEYRTGKLYPRSLKQEPGSRGPEHQDSRHEIRRPNCWMVTRQDWANA